MKKLGLIIFCYSLVYGHDPNKDIASVWTAYSRLNFVQDADQQSGAGIYARLKRVKGNQFNDIRLFGNALENDQYLYLRHKSSQIFSTYPDWYRFTTVSYEKNTLANVSLRYHYNNGIGYFLNKSNTGNMTFELGLAFDMSDYFNDTWKTSYIKSAFTWDATISKFESKIELDYFSQISDIVQSDLTRVQILGEIKYPITPGLSFILSYSQELSKNIEFDSEAKTLSYSIGWQKPISGKFLK